MNVRLVHLTYDDSVARLESDLLNGAPPAAANIYPVLTASVSLLAMASTGPFARSRAVPPFAHPTWDIFFGYSRLSRLA